MRQVHIIVDSNCYVTCLWVQGLFPTSVKITQNCHQASAVQIMVCWTKEKALKHSHNF